ncbi:MAG: hypothetical protein V3U63_08845, partial [Gemmatimonadota bacterium]
PALLAAFLWKRTTTAGGVASIAVGMGVTLAITIINWFFQSGSGHPWIETDYIVLPAASLSILTLVAVSLATPAPAREKWAPFYDTESEVPVGD